MPRGGYIAPLYKQAKRISWQYFKNYTRLIPGVKYNEAELRIDVPPDRQIQLFGADSPHDLRGGYFDSVVIDEFAHVNPILWGQIIRPSLSDRQGFAMLIGTPFGRSNQFKQFYDRAGNLPGWFRTRLAWQDTGVIPDEEIAAIRSETEPEEFAQEYEVSWSAAIKGAFYGRQMQIAEDDGRITGVPYDSALPVFTSWDLGIRDYTVVLFWQVLGSQVRMIDAEMFTSTGLPDIIAALRKKPYQFYKRHFAPHDIRVRELGSGQSRYEIAQKLGIEFTICPNHHVHDGITSFRSMIGRCWFDETNCFDVIEALRVYRTEFDEDKKTFKLSPVHDWSSHPADACRVFAICQDMTGDFSGDLDYGELDRAAF